MASPSRSFSFSSNAPSEQSPVSGLQRHYTAQAEDTEGHVCVSSDPSNYPFAKSHGSARCSSGEISKQLMFICCFIS